MKIIFTLLCGLVFSCATIAQTNTATKKKLKTISSTATSTQTPTSASVTIVEADSSKPSPEVLSLIETEYDFGKIPQGKPVTHIFEFKNLGTSPFSLDNVQASCGCTTPEWNKDSIAPGATAKITVGYNAQNEGTFTKPVTITYHGNQTKQIIIKGDVWKTPVSSAPENTKINSLKDEQ